MCDLCLRDLRPMKDPLSVVDDTIILHLRLLKDTRREIWAMRAFIDQMGEKGQLG